ncbi:hypothetical protein P3T73_11245 [Kiritimatiellota bacterium B12222]|nr:hypothetical protein P3T73_11245 [Kiritimatiellota bacterium B12222]
MKSLWSLCFFSFLWTNALSAQTLDSWPRHVTTASGIMTVYQPQLDSLKGDVITGRAAVAFKASTKSEPVFGAIWIEGTVSINKEENMVNYRSLDITETRFPEGSEQAGIDFQAAIKEGMKTWELDTTFEALKTSLTASQAEVKAQENFKNSAPEVIYRDHPALLVNIEGKTQLKPIEGTPYQNVINTPYPLLYNPKTKLYSLSVASGIWYKAKSENGPWTIDSAPAADLVKLVESRQPTEHETEPPPQLDPSTTPEIIVAHNPTELVVSEGEAVFIPLVDDLLVIQNSQTPVFMNVEDQKYYLNISGRWYQSQSMMGKWTYVDAEALPDVFSQIPADSTFADIRAYVSGTDEALEAVMDAQIPQTAAVQRGTVDLEVVMDGHPKFQAVDGTSLFYIINASETILTDRKTFYLVKDGVWYISSQAQGPWEVSDHAPPGIAGVQPSSPVYNVKYVYVYASTPEVIYVGYTPGYVCNYVMGPTVVYGTGWVYQPWVGPRYYYPRHVTWGFSARYNPVTGWGFGMSWSSGIFTFSWYNSGYWHHNPAYGPGMWGPGRYRPSTAIINTGDVNLNINRNSFSNNIQNNLNIYNRGDQLAKIENTIATRPNRPTTLPANVPERPNSLPGNRPTTLPATRPEQLPSTLPAERPNLGDLGDNNVFTDKDGNIFQNNDGNWQEQVKGSWQNVDHSKPIVKPETRPVTLPEQRPQIQRPQQSTTRPLPRPSTSNYSQGNAMQRQAHARTRASGAGGATRTRSR